MMVPYPAIPDPEFRHAGFAYAPIVPDPFRGKPHSGMWFATATRRARSQSVAARQQTFHCCDARKGRVTRNPKMKPAKSLRMLGVSRLGGRTGASSPDPIEAPRLRHDFDALR